MKNLTLTVTIALMLMATFSSCKKDDPTPVVLSQQEKDDLTVLREEEKLARDVYLYSYDKYGTSIFNNIASSEQKHMDKILTLLVKYNLPDIASTQRGVFNNTMLQTLYNDLTTQADISLVEAFTVGAIVEDLDIKDIEDFIGRTSVPDILDAYDKLSCGSRNHMRSYTKELTANGVTYTPQSISPADYAAILANANEKCGKTKM